MTVLTINCTNRRNRLGTDRMQRVVMVFCAALLLLMLSMKNRKSQESPDHAVFHVLSSGSMYVKVTGEVVHPGVYVLPVNSLASSVIVLAVPGSANILNKGDAAASRPLLNGAAVKLLKQPDGTPLLTFGQMTIPEQMLLGVPLDISRMNESDFIRLPGVGPVLAKRIVEYRQSNGGILCVGDLAAIEGIGEKKYDRIRPYF